MLVQARLAGAARLPGQAASSGTSAKKAASQLLASQQRRKLAETYKHDNQRTKVSAINGHMQTWTRWTSSLLLYMREAPLQRGPGAALVTPQA
jgi:hypothetical protein